MVLISPGTKLCLVGKTSSGKSTLLREICEECTDIFTEIPTVVYFVYQHRQDFFIPLQRKLADQGVKIVFVEHSVPSEIHNPHRKHVLLAVDDMHERNDLPTVANYFLRSARHNKITIIVNFQSLFVNNDHFRHIMANTDFIAFFYMTKIAAQLKCFAFQLFGERKLTETFIQLFHKLTSRKNGALILDLRQGVTHRIRNTFSFTSGPIEFYRLHDARGEE